MRRILHLWLPTLATDRLCRAARFGNTQRHLRQSRPGREFAWVGDVPLITITKVRGALVVDATNERAEQKGITAGQGLADARALLPDLKVEAADHAADADTLMALAKAMNRYTPFVGLGPPSGLFLDVSGCCHLFGGEEGLMEDLCQRLSRWGFAAKVALADSPAVAWALARYGKQPIVAPGEGPQMVRPLPIAGLRLEDETLAVLSRLGLKTIEQVLSQPKASLVRRFGPDLARRLNQIEETEEEPITPLAPVPDFVVERRFAEPLINLDALHATLASLAMALGEALDGRGEGARLIRLRLFHADGAVRETTVGASEPLADPKRIVALITPRLEILSNRIETDSGIDLLRLHGEETSRRSTPQDDFDGRQSLQADLTRLIDTLAVRLGAQAITQFKPCDSHQPMMAAVRTKALVGEKTGGAAEAPRSAEGAVVPSSGPEAMERAKREKSSENWAVEGCASRFTHVPDRPVTLFMPPEPVETIAAIPDGPPVRFRWRRVLYVVAAAEGPERIAPNWWEGTDPGETCDYFRVEDVEGCRFWLFRRGLYGRETSEPRWFLHGLFA
ncbi:MAG: DNA polymerase Y family protein [Devosia sp.]